jgi:hypothetical protein
MTKCELRIAYHELQITLYPFLISDFYFLLSNFFMRYYAIYNLCPNPSRKIPG